MQINRREVILVLSKLLGFVGVDDTYHGHRVGFMVWRMSGHLQLPEDQRAELVEAGLLHDIGVSSTVAHQLLLRQIDVPDAVQHCVTGEAVIASIPTFSHLAPLVRHHHEHWKRFDFDRVHPLIALFSNLIFLADRLDILMVQSPSNTEAEREQILDRLVNLQDLVFAPQCVEAMLATVEEEGFWEVLHNDQEIAALLSAEVGCCSERTISFFGLQEIANEAQILTVADIFQALMQKRPYRAPMGVDKVFSIMDRMVERGEINGDLLALIKQSRHEFVARAAA